jgi:hypothetical protein
MKNIDEFCHKYQAQVGKSTRVWTRRQSVPIAIRTSQCPESLGAVSDHVEDGGRWPELNWTD